MKISSVKLVDMGLKGVEVSYSKEEKKKELSFLNEYSKKDRRPIPKELREKFQSLVDYMLQITDLKKGADLRITGITAGENQFLISGKVSVLDGKIYAINTPLIKEADFEQFHGVMAIIEEIYAETWKHVESDTAPNATQFVMDFNETLNARDKMSKEEIDGMNEKEKTAYMMDYLEKKGAVIMAPDDIEEEPTPEQPTLGEETPGKLKKVG
jgi:hypothetical protein